MHAIITGANRGIGAALDDELRRRGWDVTGTARQAEDCETLDVTDADSLAAFSSRMSERPVDLLVCNAGAYLDKGWTIESAYTAQMWADTFAVNVTGVFMTVQTLLPQLKRAEMPKIAIISSMMASHTRAPGGSYIYRASKAAVLNVGRNLATELHGAGIAVGIYHPGWVITDMGGQEAEITVERSARGLATEFEALNMTNTGAFRTWDGHDHPY